jgi:hypothetical protein
MPKHKLAKLHRNDGLWREMTNRARAVTRKLARAAELKKRQVAEP